MEPIFEALIKNEGPWVYLLGILFIGSQILAWIRVAVVLLDARSHRAALALELQQLERQRLQLEIERLHRDLGREPPPKTEPPPAPPDPHTRARQPLGWDLHTARRLLIVSGLLAAVMIVSLCSGAQSDAAEGPAEDFFFLLFFMSGLALLPALLSTGLVATVAAARWLLRPAKARPPVAEE